MNRTHLSGFLITLLFTLTIFAFTFLVIGCYYETNDDVILTFLLKGVFTGESIPNLTLYLHGFGSLIAFLYQNLPGVPWYGLFQYSLLFLASFLAFWLIYKHLKIKLGPRIILGLLLLFYLINWYEHIFWFNYSRLPMLFAGTAGLWAIKNYQQNSEKRKTHLLLPALLFLVGLCVRPSLAIYGLALVTPLFLFNYNLKRTGFLLLPFLITGTLFFVVLTITSSPEQLQYRHYDVLKSQILDYSWCCPPPQTLLATVQQEAIANWFLADGFTLKFLDQQKPEWSYFWQSVASGKLIQLFKYLIFDQFPAIILGAVFYIWYVVHHNKRQVFIFSCYQLSFWIIIIFTGLILKIPPRLLTPAMSLYILSHLAWLPQNFKNITMSTKWPVFVKALGFGLLLVQVYKINHRATWQQQRQKQSEAVWTKIQNNYPGYVVLTAGLENELRAMSPFKDYALKNQRLLSVTSWQTLDPQYRFKWQQLTNQSGLGQALIHLSKRQKVIWVGSPEFMFFLKKYFQIFYRVTLEYKFVKLISDPEAPEKLGYYKIKFID